MEKEIQFDLLTCFKMLGELRLSSSQKQVLEQLKDKQRLRLSVASPPSLSVDEAFKNYSWEVGISTHKETFKAGWSASHQARQEGGHTASEFPNCSPELAESYAKQLNDLEKIKGILEAKIARQQPVGKTLDEAIRAVSLAKNYLQDKPHNASIMFAQVNRLIHIIEGLTNLYLASNQSEQGWVDVKDKPLNECMMGRDGECNHPKCPVTDEDEQNGRFCTLPLNDYRE